MPKCSSVVGYFHTFTFTSTNISADSWKLRIEYPEGSEKELQSLTSVFQRPWRLPEAMKQSSFKHTHTQSHTHKQTGDMSTQQSLRDFPKSSGYSERAFILCCRCARCVDPGGV